MRCDPGAHEATDSANPGAVSSRRGRWTFGEPGGARLPRHIDTNPDSDAV